MSSRKYKRLNQFRILLWLSRASFLHPLFAPRISGIASESFADNPSAAMDLVLLNLMRSRSPRRSLFLVKLLQDLPPPFCNESTVLRDFLKYVPAHPASVTEGQDNLQKLLTCRIILEHCFRLEDADESEAKRILAAAPESNDAASAKHGS